MIFVAVGERISLWGDVRDGCNPHARSAGAGVRELDADRAGCRAPGGAGCGDPVAAGAGDVRVGRPAAPAPERLPGVPGAEPGLPRHLLAKLRLPFPPPAHLPPS